MNNLEDFKKIKVLYEDDDVLALFKPKNVLVHGNGKKKKDSEDNLTLVDYILKNYPQIKNVGESLISNEGVEIQRPGIVHRLDKDTSGVILVAKNQNYFDNLKKQFKDRVIQKNYKAFVYGKFIYDAKGVNTPIGRSKNDFRKWATTREIRGQSREAETLFELIEVKQISKDKFISFLDVFPKTGRTHQIRVHAKYLNFPILADHLYAGKRYVRENSNENLFFTSQALFAYSIKFKDKNGKWLKIIADYDDEFRKAIDIFNAILK